MVQPSTLQPGDFMWFNSLPDLIQRPLFMFISLDDDLKLLPNASAVAEKLMSDEKCGESGMISDGGRTVLAAAAASDQAIFGSLVPLLLPAE